MNTYGSESMKLFGPADPVPNDYDLPRYSDFRPTGFDAHIGVEDLENFTVVYSRQRDSCILTESNFYSILADLGGESEQVQIHRFGHWGCGWFELILASPTLDKQVYEILAALEDYPIFNENDYSERMWVAVTDFWYRSNLRDRMYYCEQAGVSKMAARRDQVPEGVFEVLEEGL